METTAAHADAGDTAEWVNGEQARRMFGVSQWIWDRWRKAGAIRCGEPVGPGRRLMRYPIEQLRREIEALRAPQPSPPPGMIGAAEARARFGVGAWTWDKWRQAGELPRGQWFVSSKFGRVKLYPMEELARVIEAQRVFPPSGMITGAQAARMFGVARLTWRSWVTTGKVRCGKPFANPGGGMCYLYAVGDLERLFEEMRGEGKAYWDPKNPGYYRVPDGYVRQRDAWRMFGVDKGTWKRWEREKQITCGRRVNAGGPKLYRLEDLQRLLEEFGKYAPPYPDPDRPGTYRVPLSGYDIRRREALIDAAELPLIEGKRWGWCPGADDERDGAGHVAHSKQGETTPLHRIIMNVTDPELTVMHRNGDALDCRRKNLVVRTYSERSAAARKPRTYQGRACTSRFKGVYWSEERGKWVAQIKMGGVGRRLGRFDDEIAAAEAYDEAARELFGEHARLNFPDGIDAFLAADAAETRGDDARADFGGISRPAA